MNDVTNEISPSQTPQALAVRDTFRPKWLLGATMACLCKELQIAGSVDNSVHLLMVATSPLNQDFCHLFSSWIEIILRIVSPARSQLITRGPKLYGFDNVFDSSKRQLLCDGHILQGKSGFAAATATSTLQMVMILGFFREIPLEICHLTQVLSWCSIISVRN